MSKDSKTETKKQKFSTFSEAEKFLREIDEWHDVSHLDREIIMKWAEFLKNRDAARS